MLSHRIRWGLVLAVPITLVMSACGSNTAGTQAAAPEVSANAKVYTGAPAPPADLVTKAKSEGAVTIYTGISTQSALTNIAKGFNSLYPGISVRWVTLQTNELAGRYDTEAKAGAVQGDVILAGYSGFFGDNLKNGRILPIDQVIPGFASLYPEDALRENGQLPLEFRLVNGFAYDTNVVKGADIPTSYEDFAKPFWKGHLIGFDIKGASSYASWADMILKQLGEEKLRAIWANVIPNKKFAKTTDAAQSLAAGEGYANLFMSAVAVNGLIAAGAPIKYVQPDLCTGGEWGIAASKASPNPNAAKLFLYWALSTAGQKALTTENLSIGPLEGTPAKFWSPPLEVPEADMKIINAIVT